MQNALQIRQSAQADSAAIEAMYPLAFPDENLVPLVKELLQAPDIALSLVAEFESQLAGHVIFTRCGVSENKTRAALLAPLAVAPAHQGKGIGSAIVRAGLRLQKDSNVNLVCVLGDPGYYGRFGFRKETTVEPPYDLPAEWDEAWQSQYFDAARGSCEGRLTVPPQWQQPSLWAP